MDAIAKSPLKTTAYWLLSIVLGWYLLEKLSFLLIPITWSVFLSFALLPLCNWLEDRRLPRVLAIIISIALVTLIAFLLFSAMLNQMMGLLEDAPGMGQKLERYLEEIRKFFSGLFGAASGGMWDFHAGIGNDQLQLLAKSAFDLLAMLAVIPIFTFFFIYYKDFFHEFVLRLRLETNTGFSMWTGEISRVIQAYLTGMLIVTAVVSVLAGLVFYLLGIKYYILFALFIAIFNLIPYVGVILSSLVTISYVFLTTESLFYPLLTMGSLWLIQLVENNLITPVLVGNRIKLNPLSVIIVIILGGSLWGISGMVLFIPLLGVLKILFDLSERLSPYGYLLGSDVPITERKENLFRLIGRKWSRGVKKGIEG